ncbi:putative ATP-dependent kinase TDA10 [Rhizoctonia solani]|uniref:Putative ATP-dependent kinase TDA10 n=1 Tax=Rhizoctonia solani TaxID=456999 RepID=A0A0K6FQT9_9AGAM|nr:putative ATP-dependent kinase TDA10 [Rhizoctonia solani]
MSSDTIYPAARICAYFISKARATSQTNQLKRPLFVGFQGPQGSGKTTLTNQIKTVLGSHPEPIHAIVFSIDDLYLPYDGLVEVGRAYSDNALLQGRGLPGTHDPILGADILERLSRINVGDNTLVSLPTFDKSAYRGFGDRSNETVEVRPPVDVVILEGWCFGFQPLPPAELEKRYDEPEAEGGVGKVPALSRYFRSHSLKSLEVINGNLQNYADLWYRYFTHFIQIVPENLYDVFDWRLQQEHAMKLKNGGHGMTDEEVHNFVARYMPGYELFQDTIESQGNPWIGHGLKVVLDKQRAVMRTESF